MSVTRIRTADGREVPLDEATWADLDGQWEADGTQEMPPPLPLVTVTHEMTQREDAAQHGGMWYHADRDEYTQWLEVVLLARRRSRALFAKGEPQPICSSNDGDHPVANAPVWTMRDFVTQKGDRFDMGALRSGMEGPPEECAGCPFSSHEDPKTGEFVSGMCRSSVQYLASRVDDAGGECMVRLTATQARALERVIRQRIRGRERPLCAMRFTLETKKVQTRNRDHAYELRVAAEDLPVLEAYEWHKLMLAERDRFAGTAAIAGPAADPETGEME